jgi:hypothetical protein
MYKYINNKTTLHNKFGFFIFYFLLRCIEYLVENMKLKIKKRPTCMYVHIYIYIYIYIYIGRKLQRISLNFFFNFLQKKKKKNFSDVALFATSENSDV